MGKAPLFDQTETGKPKHGNCLFAVICTVTIINVVIVVVIRVILSAVDEINEPIIKEPYRQRLFIFLAVFSLTFFFGCWGCFCCGGYCCHLLFTAPFACSSLINNLIQSIIYSRGPSVQRLQEEIDDIEITQFSPRPHFAKTDTQPFENNPAVEGIIESEAVHMPRFALRRALSIDVGLA